MSWRRQLAIGLDQGDVKRGLTGLIDAMRNRLDKITLKGFKTIKELDEFEPGPLTILIGPNGAGKSNFISFFQMLSWALSDPDHLENFVGLNGGASTLLHGGSETTREIESELTIVTDSGVNQYGFRLMHAADDTFVYTDERYRYSIHEIDRDAPWKFAGAGHAYPRLIDLEYQDSTARVIRTILRRIIVHQFHNTSRNSRMRNTWHINDGQWLKEDGGNIAPVLYRLSECEPMSYQRILNTIRLILPFFSDFELSPYNDRLILRWRERNSDLVFGASQASDGMLRLIALVTLLLLPEDQLPDVLILDEPELGLHPFAINIIGGLIGSVSTNIQVIVATQSATLVDCFEPQEVVVVERDGSSSRFSRPNADELQEWLQEYSLSELWEKNVIGGRP